MKRDPERVERSLRTLALWQPRSSRRLTDEDARQIEDNLTGFFKLLAQWRSAEVGSTHGVGAAPSGPRTT